MDSLWRSFADVTSADTSYVGPAHERLKTLDQPGESLMATANNLYPDGTILVLLNNGVVRRLKRDPPVKKGK